MRKISFVIFSIVSLALLLFTVAPIKVEAAKKSYNRSFTTPSYKNYSKGGSLYYQRGYLKKNGTYVQPHLKTRPDNTTYNNRKYLLGY